MVAEQIKKEALDANTGKMVETEEMVETGQMIPSGLKSISWYAEYNGGKEKRIAEEIYADGKIQKQIIYNPDDPPDNQRELAIIEFKNGLRYIRRNPNFEDSSRDSTFQFDATGDNVISAEIRDPGHTSMEEPDGKLVYSMKRPVDEKTGIALVALKDEHPRKNEMTFKCFNTVELKDLLKNEGITLGSALFVLNFTEKLNAAGKREYHAEVEQFQLYDSNNKPLRVEKGDGDKMTFTHDPNTGEITGIENAVFFYKGHQISEEMLERLIKNNRALQNFLRAKDYSGK